MAQDGWTGGRLHSLRCTGYPRERWRDLTGLTWDEINARLDAYYARADRVLGDPTPEEIAARCAEIQASWTPAERERRLGVSSEPSPRGVECVSLVGSRVVSAPF